ncbi:hypothetical protein TNCV_1021341 [Trichonephila clavipes]|uniref:Uncharacterized protein n=1 Tax=Trichonephila clavipes TaxID=2585209 RepID=A0A8X6SIK0_TRICX|nr:hypothetical protein TNCV_1021341 [Trichonephila clavipes]
MVYNYDCIVALVPQSALLLHSIHYYGLGNAIKTMIENWVVSSENLRTSAIDACRISKCLRDYIYSCLKMVHLSPVLMEEVDQGLTGNRTGRSHLGPCG